MAEGDPVACPDGAVCFTVEEAQSLILWIQRMLAIQGVLEACDAVVPSTVPVDP